MACAVHCLLVPVLLASISIGAIAWLGSEKVESVLLVFAVALGGLSLIPSCIIHRRVRPILLLAIALAFLGLGRFSGESSYETPLVVAGALMLSSAHILNQWYAHKLDLKS